MVPINKSTYLVVPPASPTAPPVPTITPSPGTPEPITIKPVMDSPEGEPGHGIGLLFDNNPSTYFAKRYQSPYPITIDLELGRPYSFTTIKFTSRQLQDDLIPQTVELAAGNDGKSFTAIWEVAIPKITNGNFAEFPVPGQSSGRYLRMRFSSKRHGDPNQFQLAELELMGKPVS